MVWRLRHEAASLVSRHCIPAGLSALRSAADCPRRCCRRRFSRHAGWQRRAQAVFLALALVTFIHLVWPLLKGLIKHRRGIIEADFSDEKQSTVDSKMAILSPEVKHALRQVTTGEIEVRQLNDSMRSALEEVGFVNPAFAYTPAKFNEQHRPFIERWFKRNPL